MEKFLNSFIDWLYQNNEITPLAISDYLIDEGKVFEIAEKIYKGNKTLSSKWGFTELGEDEDYQRIFAVEDFAPIFCYYNEFYNAGEPNPKFSSQIMNNYRKSKSVRQTIIQTSPEKWRQLAVKISNVYTKKYNVGTDAIGEMLDGYCYQFANGDYASDWEDY